MVYRMKAYNIKKNPAGLIFDIDGTLYNNSWYSTSMDILHVEKLAQARKYDKEAAKNEIRAYKEKYAENNNGREPSLGQIFEGLGFPVTEIVKWREESLFPEVFLNVDVQLGKVMFSLLKKYKIIAVTNNPESIGRRTLETLGLTDCFRKVIGLDTSGVSKPHETPFSLGAEKLGLKCYEIISIGDRYEVDIKIPLKLGMGGIFVDGVKDVYKLPDFLANLNN